MAFCHDRQNNHLDNRLSLCAEAREISRQNRSGKLDYTIALVHRVSARDSGVIRLCSRDFLDHAISDSFPSHSADRSAFSLALHDGQPSNASCEHGRECHGGRIVQRNRERIRFHKFTKFVLHTAAAALQSTGSSVANQDSAPAGLSEAARVSLSRFAWRLRRCRTLLVAQLYSAQRSHRSRTGWSALKQRFSKPPRNFCAQSTVPKTVVENTSTSRAGPCFSYQAGFIQVP